MVVFTVRSTSFLSPSVGFTSAMSITASRPGRKIDYTIIDYGIMAVYQFYHGDGASYVMIVPKRIKMEKKIRGICKIYTRGREIKFDVGANQTNA